jgi:integrase
MTEDLFSVVRANAAVMSTMAELFVCLLWFTGHRAASVRQLRWDDLDLVSETVHWRADVDKVGYDHRNPLHSEFVPILERAQRSRS